MKEIKTSPIFYMGNKERLIKKGLTNLFPKNIETFYDLFGGSAVVSMNVKANAYVLNDLNSNLFKLYEMFKNNSTDVILKHIDNRIREFGLMSGIHKQSFFRNNPNGVYPTELQRNITQRYNKFRDKYNENKNVLDLYVLSLFSNSHNIRFNSNGNFNMSIGNAGYCENHKNEIKQGCEFFSKDNAKIYNCSFRVCTNVCQLNINDFVYLDPPYFDTTATYNEQNAWTIENEKQLQHYCEVLNKNGVKWGMSNSFANKGKINQQLIDWCNKNNWNVTHFDVKYSSMGKGNANNDEVYICNYEVQQ